MDRDRIKLLIGGIEAPAEERRQAWIEYGGLLAQCPYTQRNQVGKWVVEQGLDYVEDDKDRSASKRLFNLSIDAKIKLGDCKAAHPRTVIAWLIKTGQIESLRKRKTANQSKPDTEPKAAKVKEKVVTAAEVSKDGTHLISKNYDKHLAISWTNSVSREARSARFENFIKPRLDILQHRFSIDCDMEKADQIAHLFNEFIGNIEADPLLVAVVIQRLSNQSFKIAHRLHKQRGK